MAVRIRIYDPRTKKYGYLSSTVMVESAIRDHATLEDLTASLSIFCKTSTSPHKLRREFIAESITEFNRLTTPVEDKKTNIVEEDK